MSFVGIIGAAMCGLVMSLTVKQLSPNYSVYVSVVTFIVLATFAFDKFRPVITYLGAFTRDGNIGTYGELIIKLTSIGAICAVASGICLDCGERTIASGIEFAGKGAAALTVLPVLEQLINSAREFLLSK